MKVDMAGPLEGRQRLNHGQQFHTVIGGLKLTAKQLLERAGRSQYCAPAPQAGIALAGAIGINLD